MADALLSMVVKKIGEALVSKVMEKLGEEVSSVGGAEAELEKISSTFESIQELLNDAEIIQFHDKSMQLWLKKLKDVAYDVEDLLDEMIPWPEPESRTDDGDDQQRMENQAWRWLFSLFTCCGLEDWIRLAHESWTDGDDTDNGSIADKVRTFFSAFSHNVALQRNFAHQIKEVSAKLDQIAADKSKFSFTEIHSFRGGSHPDKAEFQTSSRVDESQMLGREEEKNIIISKLISGSSDEKGRIHVISIIGVGGLGKTTLAQLICKDGKVKSHFHKVLWVCVSDDFNVINLLKAIIEAAGGDLPHSDQPDSLQNKLDETLQGKRFLLVLDDVWNDSSEKWEKLWLSFQNCAHGSKILVTTRSEKVASTCRDSAYMHKLKCLSDDDCWILFSSRAFAGRKVEDYPALKKIGREIVKKCRGVPLSATVMGSAMPSPSTMSTQDWQNILDSQTWEIPDIVKGILPALLLSYYNLPLHLKPCFAYCSIFPKDHEMEKDRLVQLWLAQGFIKPQGRREMEAIGGEYFDDLLRRSLLQDAYVDKYGVTKCKMHDLLHDLIQFITKNECCIFENRKSDSSSVLTVRHSSFIPTWETSHIPAPRHAKKLRTLLQIGYSKFDTIPDHLFQCARSLRALDFGGIKELPSTIGLLKHLRYLDLSYSGIVELPESVTHLRNLQTLKLNRCRELGRLPRGMGKLVSLRHLEFEDTRELRYLPEGLGRISSLRTLSWFIVGGDGGCKIGELKRLNSLQGKLAIQDLMRVGNGDEAKEAQLENKLQLRVLFLQMSRDDALNIFGSDEELPDDEVDRMDDVLEALRPPHTNLEKLVIERCIGSKFPTWMEDLPFSNLVSLRLLDCYKCTQLPGLGRLPSLKYLQIEGGLVKRVGSEFYGNSSGGGINGVAFPKLEELEFSDMYELEEWELRLEDGDIMPSLQSLKISGCRKLEALPTHLPKSLTSLHIESSGDEVERMNDVLEALQPPHTNLEKLVIKRYIGSKFLTWMEDLPFSNLVELRLIKCYKCTQLPGLGRLPLLKYLGIWAGLVKRVGSEFYGNSSGGGINGVSFPKLEELEFTCMYELEEWELRLEDGDIMPSLHSLTINNCPKLKATPTHLPKSLTSLTISACFQISGMQGSLPLLENFTLWIDNGEILWPLPNLPSLKTFKIFYLKNTTCHPDGWKQLESLETLTIYECSKLRSLPDDLGQLKSLRSLEIYGCPELLSLPRGLQGLTHLEIDYSPMLAERCRGEDWSNISHIPNIKIDREEIGRGAMINSAANQV